MSDGELAPLLSALDAHIDNLEELLEPLSSQALRNTTSKLPVLDQAKLYTLTNYTINTLLFCALKIQDVDVKQHPVYRELTRTRQYFQKIKDAEANGAAPPEGDQPRARLDKDAAARFVRAGLSGNDKFDLERAARKDAEQQRAQGKLELLEEEKRARKATKKEEKKSKKRKRDVSHTEVGTGADETDEDRRRAEEAPSARAPHSTGSQPLQADKDGGESTPTTEVKDPKSKRPSKFKKSSKAPRGAGEVMRDLLTKGRAKRQAS